MKKRIACLAFALFLIGKLLPGQVELLGELTRDEILQNLPDWQAVAASYSPNLDVITRLQAVNEEIQIEIFLGTWCPDSKQHVSAYFKIMDLVQNPLIRTTYIGIPRDRDDRQEYTQGKNIERIPTFIVTQRGQEAGRIVERPRISVEEDIWKIIQPR
jgi:thiol-disulfide isomerase/thioredoxin